MVHRLQLFYQFALQEQRGEARGIKRRHLPDQLPHCSRDRLPLGPLLISILALRSPLMRCSLVRACVMMPLNAIHPSTIRKCSTFPSYFCSNTSSTVLQIVEASTTPTLDILMLLSANESSRQLSSLSTSLFLPNASSVTVFFAYYFCLFLNTGFTSW